MEYLIAIVIIICTLIFFVLMSRKKEVEHKYPKSSKTIKEEDRVKHTTEKLETPSVNIDNSKIANLKDHLINSFREGKELKNPKSSTDGKTILFHDDKRVFLCFLKNFSEKNPKILSKSVEQDVISDAALAEDTK
jgi:hypothetical protein